MLGLKADALEILIALDNGDVEIYDRYSLNLTHTVVGKFLIKMCIKSYSSYVSVLTIVGFFLSGKQSVSPVVLDVNSDLILVEYLSINTKDVSTLNVKQQAKTRRSSGTDFIF